MKKHLFFKNAAAGMAAAAVFVLAGSTALSAPADSAAEDPFTYASSYEEIYEALLDLQAEKEARITAYNTMTVTVDAAASLQAAADTDWVAEEAAPANETAGSGSSISFSETNVQEAGVDEGDIVKTDGTYIYILRSSGEFVILQAAQTDAVFADEADGSDAEGGEPSVIYLGTTKIESENDLTAKEMYVYGDTLNILTEEYSMTLEEEGDTYSPRSTRMTALYTYDISDRRAPVLTGQIWQEGWYADSRRAGDYIYLFSSWSPTIGSSLAESNIAPQLNGSSAEASCYYLPDTLTDEACLIISSVNIHAPSVFSDNKVLVSGADSFYVSQENIYILNNNYQNDNTLTEITKFSYLNGAIHGVAASYVTGYLNDSFSMNEYEGNLRVVTTYYGDDLSAAAAVTDWTEHSALYVLDESLNRIGLISDLAEGEKIRSARFLGNTGYFVTFRQTDPLFSVDLSDPEDPRILGELKISGFSSYLHFYGEDLLLGLGYEADETTGITTGLKLSMFDISDPSDVKEADKYVIPGITWCESLNNYKSILVDAEKNLIGFYCNDRYLLFSYDRETGFTQEMIYDFYTDQLAGQGSSASMRGLYINDTLFLAGSSFAISFDMANHFEKTQVLNF